MTRLCIERHGYTTGIPGPLTYAIMGVLWRAGRPLALKYIVQRVRRDYKDVAPTTVSTTIYRLMPAWVSRPRPGMYEPALSRQAAITELRDRLESLIDDVTLAIEEA